MTRSLPPIVAALVFLSGTQPALPQDAVESPTLLDDLEYRIEIGRHQGLVDARNADGATPAPFASDGCSGGLSAGWAFAARVLPDLAEQHGDHPPWEACCVTHDRAYHSGGPQGGDADASFTARRAADTEMWQCVIAVGETRAPSLMDEYGLSGDAVALLYRGIGDAMYRAVRLGGAPCSPLPWRWGFGWNRC